MASAVLASGNETSWMQSGGGGGGNNRGGNRVMGKVSYLNPNSNPNPISNPKKKKKHFHHLSNGDFPVVRPTVSDDAQSFIQKPVGMNRSSGFDSGGYLTYSISAYSKAEILELRERLVSELHQVRSLRDRIESGNLISSFHNARWKSTNLIENKSAGPLGSFNNNVSKRLPNGFDNGGIDNVSCVMDDNMLKECKQILTKLLKKKSSWYFKAPVDAVALNLHDYHQIIKRPMDLGTVKSILNKNLYPSPMDFAADVRLTFNNAMLYNPKTDEAHTFAESLLGTFEELFRPIQDKIDLYTSQSQKTSMYEREYLGEDGGLVEEVQGSSWNHIPTPERTGKEKMSPISRKLDRMQSQSSASTPSNTPQPVVAPKAQSPLPVVSPVRSSPVKQQQAGSQLVGRGKLPKPRAKDPNKRDMSMEEKHKLGEGLQSLPQEKMPQLVQIIRRRNEQLSEDGDEIELDIQTLDTETLWELDRFVTNWKKMVSKTKRQALMVNISSNPVDTSAAEAEVDDQEAVDERNDFAKKPKKGSEVGDDEDDIDIDDDMPATNFPPVEIEKDEIVGQDNGNGNDDASSSSSSSSSDSSSSSGNGSGLTEVSFSSH